MVWLDYETNDNLSTICLLFVYFLSTFCPGFVLVLPCFCPRFVTTKTKKLSFVKIFRKKFWICQIFVLKNLKNNKDKTWTNFCSKSQINIRNWPILVKPIKMGTPYCSPGIGDWGKPRGPHSRGWGMQTLFLCARQIETL